MYGTATDQPRAQAARRTRTARDSDRRTLLLNTTLRLIAEQGLDAVSHRTVADAAGVSLGSTTYWFDSRQHMLVASLEYFIRLETEGLNDRLAGILGKRLSRRRLVDELTALLLPQLEDERWRTVAMYTMMLEASRQPELEDVCREWTAAWDEALTDVFASAGAPDPRLEAQMFLAMLDGLLLGQLAAPDPEVEKKLIRPALETWFSRLPFDGSVNRERSTR
jgi:DNA-binding transcriptional regulator YbjK